MAKTGNYKLGKKEYERQYRLKHLDKMRERDRERYKVQKEQHKTRSEKYYLEHKDEIKQRTKKWAMSHPELMKAYQKKWGKNHPECLNKKAKKWRTNNPEKSRMIKRISETKRRRVKENTLNSVNLEEINNLIEKSDNKCFWCDENIPEGQMHLDHVYPLSKGGGHTISNIVVSCADCNQHKYNKDPEEWLEEILSDN